MDKEEVQRIAHLAQIELSEDEQECFGKEIKDILEYVSSIREVSGEQQEKVTGEHYNILREDGEVSESGAFREAILEEAPKTKDGFIEVKKVL